MKVFSDDVWKHWEAGAYIGIPTNNVLRSNGELVMGAGVAKQAADRLPGLAKAIGAHVASMGGLVRHYDRYRVVTFPTKYHWREKGNLALIRQSANDLAGRLGAFKHLSYPLPFVLPAPGCGLGGLTWDEVEPALAALNGLNARVVMR